MGPPLWTEVAKPVRRRSSAPACLPFKGKPFGHGGCGTSSGSYHPSRTALTIPPKQPQYTTTTPKAQRATRLPNIDPAAWDPNSALSAATVNRLLKHYARRFIHRLPFPDGAPPAPARHPPSFPQQREESGQPTVLLVDAEAIPQIQNQRAAARTAGYTRATLYRARNELGDQILETGVSPRDPYKTWTLPPARPNAFTHPVRSNRFSRAPSPKSHPLNP